MNVLIDLFNFDINNVFFQETKRNIIIDGEFSKIMYSTPEFVMNGIYVNYECMCYSFRTDDRWINSQTKSTHNIFDNPTIAKTIVGFDPYHEKNIILVKALCNLEELIVAQYKKMKSIHKYNPCNLKNQLLNGVLRVNMMDTWTPSTQMVLKISGIWETSNQVGITFKFQTKENETSRFGMHRISSITSISSKESDGIGIYRYG
jgi:hypothetical protein